MYMTQNDKDDIGSEKTPKRPKKESPDEKESNKPKKTSKKESDEFKKKISKALSENLDEYIKARNLNQKQIAAINGFVEEHLSCFVLLGYTVSGDPISLVNATTQKDSDSLSTLLQKFLGKYTDSPNPPPVL